MSFQERRALALLVGAALTGCAPLAAPPGSAAVAVREHLSGRFIALIGVRAQHAPTYLGTPGTNYYCLRSFVDRQTGKTADQLYVSDSYDGPERNWDGAHDGAGRSLVFIPVTRDKITCEAGCSYVEEFAADIPESELRARPQGFAVTFTDRAGDQKTINLSADQIAAQLAAVGAQKKAAASSTLPAAAASPQSAAHQE